MTPVARNRPEKSKRPDQDNGSARACTRPVIPGAYRSVNGAVVKAIQIQAVWFRTTRWNKDGAVSWLKDHDFKHDVMRTKVTEGAVSHLIFPQFDPDEADPDTFRTLADDWPDGVSVTVAERMKNMQIQHTKGTQSAENPFEFIMSDESIDRVGDIIEAKGWTLEQFKANPIALFGHSHDKPIGTWENVRVVGKRLIGRLKLAAEGTSAEIDTIRKLVEQRILRAVSVGFQPLDAEPIKDTGGYRFKKQILHECSLVAVPANANALSLAKSLGADRELLNKLFAKPNPNLAKVNKALARIEQVLNRD